MSRQQLTPDEVAAMWLFGKEYSEQRLGISSFCAALPPWQRVFVTDFVRQMRQAIVYADRPLKAPRRG